MQSLYAGSAAHRAAEVPQDSSASSFPGTWELTLDLGGRRRGLSSEGRPELPSDRCPPRRHCVGSPSAVPGQAGLLGSGCRPEPSGAGPPQTAAGSPASRGRPPRAPDPGYQGSSSGDDLIKRGGRVSTFLKPFLPLPAGWHSPVGTSSRHPLYLICLGRGPLLGAGGQVWERCVQTVAIGTVTARGQARGLRRAEAH